MTHATRSAIRSATHPDDVRTERYWVPRYQEWLTLHELAYMNQQADADAGRNVYYVNIRAERDIQRDALMHAVAIAELDPFGLAQERERLQHEFQEILEVIQK